MPPDDQKKHFELNTARSENEPTKHRPRRSDQPTSEALLADNWRCRTTKVGGSVTDFPCRPMKRVCCRQPSRLLGFSSHSKNRKTREDGQKKIMRFQP